MGRGDNRRTAKMLRRKSWRKKKTRDARRIEEGKAAPKAPRGAADKPLGPNTVRRPGE